MTAPVVSLTVEEQSSILLGGEEQPGQGFVADRALQVSSAQRSHTRRVKSHVYGFSM